ncbi:hypothetical protein H2204_002425 [Knufia peltigerae]|uniref:Methyltransferase domain-containing protein n=1 Tax=Knufia peltigerae TaxID=1002370 RepID=A0AA38YBH8_9EURO|nr:hypothetical protein H2204_002425 [Knufia peltigerae]
MSDPGDLRNENNTFLQRVYAATTATESQGLYDQWAAQYDKDLEGLDYAFPTLAAEALSQALAKASPHSSSGGQLTGLRIADAGCGTGLVGRELATKYGADNVSGLDISSGMLEVARKTGCYAKLDVADLSKPLTIPDGSFDAVVCVGTLTRGHVGPDPVFNEFVRIVKQGGGVMVITVLDDIWESGGYKAEVERLKDDGSIEILRADVVGVRTTSNVGGRLLVLKKL